MLSPYFIGAGMALASAVLYGGADFCGGLATRRSHHYQALVLSSWVGVLTLIGLAVIGGEGWPAPEAARSGALAGVCGALGLAALYRGLATGSAAVVSPVSGVITASIPVVVAAGTRGLPEVAQLVGFALALPGIWLVAAHSSSTAQATRAGLLLGIWSGIGCGLFLVFAADIESGSVFGALGVAKATACLSALALARLKRLMPVTRAGSQAAILTGLIDPVANALYVLASGYTRMDVAAVLVSLYPAGTVLLARLFLKEQIVAVQWGGVILCLVAIVLITL